MRLWSLHPRYLDRAGLVALWRESLLARAVLDGETTGYVNHPQLERFRAYHRPLAAVNRYLQLVHEEGRQRGYRFDAAKLNPPRGWRPRLSVTDGQLAFEYEHLKSKVRTRDAERYQQLLKVRTVEPHPLFKVTPGDVAARERGHLPPRERRPAC